MRILARLPAARGLAFPLPAVRLRAEVLVGAIAGLIVLYLAAVPLAMLVFSSFRATGNVLPFANACRPLI